jgi:uncharacterized membrane protein YgdD (TMEM256/DUF423 family)
MSAKPSSISGWWIVAGVLGALGVILGAFGAHGLETVLAETWPEATRARRLDQWEVAVRYHMYHALALCALATLASWRPSLLCNAAGMMFVLGVIFFSGFLYAYVLVHAKWMIAPVPFGGALLILGWCFLSIEAIRHRK